MTEEPFTPRQYTILKKLVSKRIKTVSEKLEKDFYKNTVRTLEKEGQELFEMLEILIGKC